MLCSMSDGPTCMPFEKQYGHSKLLFKNPAQDATKYSRLWRLARSHEKLTLKDLTDKSYDKGRYEIGVQVVEKSFSFILKFFLYDEVTKDEDFVITKSFGTVFSPTVELVVKFLKPVILS